MGLCKCPRKKVTNLFCFEHRVNVCEHCLLETHDRCVVQSYLEWLQDSDFDPNCTLCSRPLSDERDAVVRLLCLHVYHWECLDKVCSSLPPTTAPAGYKCPLCQANIIPRQNNASPIADRLKGKLADAHWARAGLGLPLLFDFVSSRGTAQSLQNGPAAAAVAAATPSNNNLDYSQVHTAISDSSGGGAQSSVSTRKVDHSRHQIDFNMGDAKLSSKSKDADVGEAKYQRRSAMEWLARWLRSRNLMGTRRPNSSCKRYMLLLFVIAIVSIVIFALLSGSGSGQESYDPFLDPLANPNIRIDKAEDVYGHMA